jgi:hypothetical protein
MPTRLPLALGLALLASAIPLAADVPSAVMLDRPATLGEPVRGGASCAGGEIYDDGGAENGYSGSPVLVSSFEAVQRFTPAAYPFAYDTVCIGLVSGGGRTLDFEIEVRDDDGPDGSPGALLGALPVQAAGIPDGLPCTFFTFDISSLELEIPDGSAYVGVRWNPMLFPDRFLCADESNTTPVHAGYVNFNLGEGWESAESVFPGYNALLVRAAGAPVPPSVLEVPALDDPGLAVLVALLVALSLLRLRRRTG